MRPHIQETIRELTAQIARNQDIIQALHALDQSAVTAAVAPSTENKAVGIERAGKVKPIKTRVATGGGAN